MNSIRIACIGDSLTYGARLRERASACYPARLAELLGRGWEVANYGRTSTCVARATGRRGRRRGFRAQSEHQEALASAPDLVVSNLGVNDVMTWETTGGDFVADYLALLADYAGLASAPRLLLWHELAPLFPGRALAGSAAERAVNEAIAEVARSAGAATVDLRAPLAGHPEWFPDHLHPDARGAEAIAEVVADAVGALEPELRGRR